jgi:ferredoxin
MTSLLLKIAVCFLPVFLSSSFHFTNIKSSIQRSRSQLYHKVTVQHDGKDTILEVDEGETILSVALEAGIDLPHDCDFGVCLTCPSRIVSGEVDQTGGTLDDSVLEQGFALTCCSYPRSDVVIRSIDEKELVDAQFSDRT